MRLENKLAIITGAASGIGSAGVRLFLSEGAKVAAIDVNGDGLADLAAAVRSEGNELITVTADLATVKGATSSVLEAASALGGVDVLWANAGTLGPTSIENLDLESFDVAIALNVRSTALAIGQVVAHMRKRHGGAIVLSSSVSGLVGSPRSPIYSACKFGMRGLAKSLAQTLAQESIRVNTVCPGITDTPMIADFLGQTSDPANAKETIRLMLQGVPMGRMARPEEVAHAALWLASDDASFVTGIELPVDGGFTAR